MGAGNEAKKRAMEMIFAAFRKPPRRCAAFTMVELIVVLLVVGILVAAGNSMFASKDRFDERFFSDDVLSALRYAQKLAVATSCEVQFDISGGAYTLNQRTTPDCTDGAFTTDVSHPGTGDATYTGTAPSGVSFSSTLDPIVFDSNGQANNSGGTPTDATVSVGSVAIEVVGETGFSYVP